MREEVEDGHQHFFQPGIITGEGTFNLFLEEHVANFAAGCPEVLLQSQLLHVLEEDAASLLQDDLQVGLEAKCLQHASSF